MHINTTPAYLSRHIIAPLLLGIILYGLFRGIPFLKWSPLFLPSKRFSFFIYNLPDALWLYALISSLRAIWGEKLFSSGRFWFSFTLILSIGSEIAQYFRLIPGTFDIRDIIIYLATFLLFVTPGTKPLSQ